MVGVVPASAVIGRERELRLVEAFLDTAGSGTHALLLSGEAGIGKTTVWHAGLDGATERGYRVLVTRPTEAEARIPFAALNDLFGELLDMAPPQLPPPQQTALEVALMRASATDAPVQPLALSLAVLELLRLAASVQPIALAIDDLQWLDDSSASVLRFALRRVEAERVVVLATERTRTGVTTPPILVDLPVQRIAVGPLELDALDRLIDQAVGLQLAPSQLRRVHRSSGGNPFYALEVGRALKARDSNRLDGPLPLPGSLSELLTERLDSLSPEAREVTMHAAALSQPTEALLERTLGAGLAGSGLAAARDAGVLAAGDPIRFIHPLLAGAAYTALDEEERRRLHRRLAAVVTEPEELARHLALGAAGPDPEVASALSSAAAHALARGAPDAAAELSELSADLTPEADPARAERMADAGRYRLMAGDIGQARQLLEKALEEPIARQGPPRAELLFGLARVRQLMDDFTAAEALGREALANAGDDVQLTVKTKLLMAGVAYITESNWADGAGHATEAMAIAEAADDPGLMAMTIGPYASWRYATGGGVDEQLGARVEQLEPWTRGFRSLDHPSWDLAGIELLEGRTSAALARQRVLLDRAERDGDYSSLPFLLGNAAFGDFLAGRRHDARDRVGRAIRLAQTTEQRTAQVNAFVYRARLEARYGEPDEARSAATRAFELMDATNWRMGEWLLRSDLALLELSLGDPRAALDVVAGALEPPGPDDSGRRRWAQPVAADALVALGRTDDARAVLEGYLEHVARHGSPRLRADGLRSRARLLAAVGRTDGADGAIAEAEAVHREMGDGWELARTLLVVADIHRRARRRARARDALREAIDGFAFLGARIWERQAREQLARIDGAREEGGLTPTQREVAELVATGISNREVGDRLFMSHHTVEAHLSAIYRALGIRSRGQLSVALAENRA